MLNKKAEVNRIEKLSGTSLSSIYNLEHKLKYFDYRSRMVSNSTLHEIVLIFNTVSKVESFFNKDIILFSKSEILYFLKMY